MSGIVGYRGETGGVSIVLDCLERLEYRGYDSAGVGAVRPGIAVVAIATTSRVTENAWSNIEEGKAREGLAIAIVDDRDEDAERHADSVRRVPTTHDWVQPLLVALPLQLLAYCVGMLRGCDVDQRRNLAKSVTVE